jgi:hypothetical protein
MFNCAGQAHNSVPRLIRFAREAHCAHRRHRDTCAGHCGYDFNHGSIGYGYSLATLAASLFTTVTGLAALALSLPGQLWFALRAVKACGASFAAYCHDLEVAILPVRGMAPLPRHHANDGDGEQ